MFLLLLLLTGVYSQFSTQLLGQAYRTKLAGLENFSAQYLNFSTGKSLLIFGGQLKSLAVQQLLQINMTSKPFQVTNLTKNSSSITARYGHCSLVSGYKMYIYGGKGKDGSYLNDLWEYNWNLKSWSKIGNTIASYKKCSMAYFNQHIYIFVVTNNSLLVIHQADLRKASEDYQFTQVGYNYANSVLIQSKIWLNVTKQYKILVESSPISVRELGSLGSLQYTNTLSAEQILIFQFPSVSSQTFLLVTQNKICSINISSMHIQMLRTHKKVQFNVGTVYTGQWLFFINADSFGIFIRYFGGPEFKTQGILTYENMENLNFYYEVFIFENDLYLISQSSLNSWIIRRNCQNIENKNVQNCFYQKIHCKQGYRGANCSSLACPNTLSLFDNITNQILLYECSNHGTCINSKCVCDQNWLGEDCSQYNRTSCQNNGQIVQNWPIMNCQCKSQTIGGNSCEVKFCYNDCSNHGTCEKNGKCVCDSGFFGQDCSVTIIKFPGATFSIQN